MQLPRGRPFFKMSGSGNDFVVFDARTEPAGALAAPEALRELCARGTGIGADGVVFLEPSERASFRMSYFNSDGSRASLCGNAALCCTRLGVDLGAGSPSGLAFESDTGLIRARVRDGLPEIDLQPVREVAPDAGIPALAGEQRLGFALAGVPHLVVLVDALQGVDVPGRGRELRRHPSLPQGANVNFVAQAGAEWGIRTFERGVEGETLACGTGAVASGLLLHLWGLSGRTTTLRTRSGEPLRVTVEERGGEWHPSLGGQGRIVYEGRLGEF